MNWIDICIVSVILVSALSSLGQGFVTEVLSLSAWFVAYVVALNLSESGATLLVPYFGATLLRLNVAFMSLFVITLLLLAWVNSLIMQAMDYDELSLLDRVLAVPFGGLRGCLMVMMMVFLISTTPVSNQSLWQASQLIPPLQYGNQLLSKQFAAHWLTHTAQQHNP